MPLENIKAPASTGAAAAAGVGPVPGAAAAAAPAAAGGRAARPIPREATVIVIGAGPAGIGTAALLEQCGIDVVVLERGEVGQSFKAWLVECAAYRDFFSSPFLPFSICSKKSQLHLNMCVHCTVQTCRRCYDLAPAHIHGTLTFTRIHLYFHP